MTHERCHARHEALETEPEPEIEHSPGYDALSADDEASAISPRMGRSANAGAVRKLGRCSTPSSERAKSALVTGS